MALAVVTYSQWLYQRVRIYSLDSVQRAPEDHHKIRYTDSTDGAARLDIIRRMILNLLRKHLERQKTQIFDHIVGYEGIKRTFLRSLNFGELVPCYTKSSKRRITESNHKIRVLIIKDDG
jgi:hypothetical protein